MNKRFFLLIIMFITNFYAYAQIVSDDTLSSVNILIGPDYQIGADLGQQRGGNLFHSFQDFNLNSLESATFSGPAHIQNVINRITGKNPSNIDGLLRSTIPNANLYFLNPFGIIFGPNFQLDIQGAFHVGASSSILFKDGTEFNGLNPTSSLTVAPVESFGFLSGDIRVITSQVSPFEGKDLSLIADNIYLENGAQVGSVSFSEIKAGNIYIRSNLLELSGEFESFPSGIFSSGFSIGDAGDIRINSNEIILRNGGLIAADNFTTGLAGNISIRSQTIKMIGQAPGGYGSAIITTSTDGDGKGIDIQTKTVSILNGGQIATFALGLGKAGNISINCESIVLDGVSEVDSESGIFTMSGDIEYLGFDTGQAGIINITTNYLEMRNRGQINAGAFGTGPGGELIINANWIRLDNNASIETSTFSNDGGDLTISTPNYLWMGDSAKISTSVGDGEGDGGNIRLDAPFLVLDNSNIIAQAYGGRGGNIDITTTSIYKFSESPIDASSKLGIDGEIRIDSPDVDVSSMLIDFESGFIDVSSLLGGLCAKNQSRFVVYNYKPKSDLQLACSHR